ncbi:neural cell adhesion molecule 2-like isoform X2 [Zophobas morio]|uniref:neural cell adhesion molecule 2-like isoform X2 n=1 Tax=Zophobas morio TaxID=2755281 RepID=UPI0030834083
MEIKISAFIFIFLYTVHCSPSKSNDFELDSDYDMQNDNDNYGGNYEDTDDTVEEKKMSDLPLQINTREEEFIRDIGEKVVLPCEITGSNYVQIWRKKNSKSKDIVLFQAGIKMAATPNMKLLTNGSLEISNLHAQDTGEYECNAMDTKQNSPKIRHKVILNVPPQIELLVAKDNVTILKNGDILILTCRASGFPKPVISWHKGSSRFDIQGDVLEIPNVKHHNAGTYKCLADNKIGEPAFSFINIKVEFKPSLTIEKMIVSSENNSETELECQVHSEPRAQVVWKKDGINIVNTERIQLKTKGIQHNLILKNIQDSDFGVYVCSATNSLGTSEKSISLVSTPAIYRFVVSQTDGKPVLTWEVQSKSNLSSHELVYRRQGESEWVKVHPEDKIEVKPIEDDIYGVRYTFNKGLDPGDYEFKVRSENRKGWSEYFRTSAEERQVTPTPTLPTQPDVPAEHQESESQSGFIKESSSSAPETSDSPSLTPANLLLSVAVFAVFQMRSVWKRI